MAKTKLRNINWQSVKFYAQKRCATDSVFLGTRGKIELFPNDNGEGVNGVLITVNVNDHLTLGMQVYTHDDDVFRRMWVTPSSTSYITTDFTADLDRMKKLNDALENIAHTLREYMIGAIPELPKL